MVKNKTQSRRNVRYRVGAKGHAMPVLGRLQPFAGLPVTGKAAVVRASGADIRDF
jgi:hypothetical protein